ncbi:MAG: Flp family type IVb pilin [Bryobacterales bacterium]|nr:Flp family type IVb pilin [Bryobacterales bacterium]
MPAIEPLWKRTVSRLGRDCSGQDLIEYALMAALVAVACGAIMPPVGNSISTIFSKVTSVASLAS